MDTLLFLGKNWPIQSVTAMPIVTAELHSHKNVSEFLESRRKPLRNDVKVDVLFQSPLVGFDRYLRPDRAPDHDR